MKNDSLGVSHPDILVVDLDKTLIDTDLLLEAILCALVRSPLLLFKIFFLGIRDVKELKCFLADLYPIKAPCLPYNQNVLNHIRDFKEQGGKVFLVSGSHHTYVSDVANYLNLFDDHFGTDKDCNLVGRNKRDFLVSKFGELSFNYLADSKKDIYVWLKSHTPLLVRPSKQTMQVLDKNKKDYSILQLKGTPIDTLLQVRKAIRPHHWLKNVLVFLPAITAHRIHEPNIFITCLIAFLAFCTTASSVYIINDLCDIHHDRTVKSKKSRPFASGQLSIVQGAFLAVSLLLSTVFICTFLPGDFVLVLGIYFLVTTLYSFRFKSVALLDVFTLSSLYTLRIFGGATAAAIPVTPWFITFSLFLFTSLAFVKRYAELINNFETDGAVPGRGYTSEDRTLLSQFGITSGYLSVLVLALYINNPDITSLYSRPYCLWFLCAILTYWISRLWLLSTRKKMFDDPVVFAIKDWQTYILFTISAITLFYSI